MCLLPLIWTGRRMCHLATTRLSLQEHPHQNVCCSSSLAGGLH